ncbi:mannitol dehydrogenase family protein [Rhodobacterales bacterium]|nr:mannitol dehydrogenase family protein [Rhodobacterales bacterium]
MEAGLPADLPRLQRQNGPAPKPGIVHLGLGAFYRAHVAIYVEEAMEASGGDWGIVGVSLQSPTMHDNLAPQDYVYTAEELRPQGPFLRQVEILSDVLVARDDPEAVLRKMADPGIRIVTLTITEKGYCHDPASGRLNLDHPDIVHDLEEEMPLSAPGYLVRALERRKAAGHPPFTVLTCDNLPDNGPLVRGIVLELAERIGPELAQWIASEGRFPATMVDRIVPATKPEDVEALAARTGRLDAAPVTHEPFRQWVVEDDFVSAYGNAARPDLAASGVELVDNVTPYERMKLRMLNGTHSALAYLGYLAGMETISETVADTVLAGYVKRLWRTEIAPSFDAPQGIDLAAYADALFSRYANPAIRHRTWQIAMDGSQKLPQRILATLHDNIARDTPSPGLTAAVAAWMIYVGGTDLSGRQIDVRDPMAERLRSLSEGAENAAEKVRAFLDIRDIFDADLAETLRPGLIDAYEGLRANGVRRTLEELQ